MPKKELENERDKEFLNPIYITKDFRPTSEKFFLILSNTKGDYQETMRDMVTAYVKQNRRFLDGRRGVQIPKVDASAPADEE